MPIASTNPPKTFRWPGSPNKHTVSWEAQKAAVAARRPAAAAPAAPAAPAARAPLAAPPDAAYLSGMAGAQQTRENTISGLQQQRTGQLIGYGYSEDPVSGALTFNPNDPFSKASLLKKNYDTSRARAGQQMGSTGGLYSGAYQTQQDVINRGQLGGEDALQKSLGSWLAQNTINQATAGTNYLTTVGGLEGERVGRIADNPLYSPDADIAAASAVAAPGAVAAPPKGGIGTAATKTNTLLAAPGASGVRTTTRKTPKGKVKTYTRSVHRA